MEESSERDLAESNESRVPDRPPDVQSVLSIGPHGTLRWSVQARPPQGEEGANYPPLVLVAYLNRRGQGWSDPKVPAGPEAGVDYIAHGPLGELRMQVTRVPTDPQYYRDLGKVGHTEADSTFQDLADDLIAAIRHKAPAGQEAVNKGIILLLDAHHSPAHGFRQVLEDFDTRYQSEASATGFREIWLVSALHFHRVSPGEWLDQSAVDVA